MTHEAGGTATARATTTGTTVDTRGRPLRDLRVSVTDRCNFRCVYCMPRDTFGPDHAFLPRGEILTFAEITRLVAIFTRLGVHKVRLTGGEPLVRRDLATLVAMLRDNQAITDLTLTTNGSLLAANARALAGAGLDRVTISLDALDDPTFGRMNDAHFPVARVLEGIEAAETAGLGPIKVNMVVKRGWNEAAVLPMARQFRWSGRTVRFIEYMDVGHSNGWRLDDVVPASEMLAMISAEFPLEPMAPAERGEVARRYRYADGGGEIGLIASVTQPFCGDCVRARVSADGKLFTCLFAVVGHDLRALVRGGASDDELEARLRRTWNLRDDRYSEVRSAETVDLPKVEMSYIGG
ncbi:MAG: GTP 3',8-cyclase MoaA [Chloroflexota bacterium]|nr:GTP 3',8-cyclase MoaA [Chloroflexota bacterium]